MCECVVSAWESGYISEGRGRLMHDSNTNLTPCSEKEISRRTMRSPPSKSQSKKQLPTNLLASCSAMNNQSLTHQGP